MLMKPEISAGLMGLLARKQRLDFTITSELGAAYVLHFLFLAWISVVFSSVNQTFYFTENWLPSKLSGGLGQQDDR